ncbi:MAG: 50S ribosomal protein L9 [Alphaproteobacteria bacterium]
MQVILLERVERLGNMGDVVNVKPGFARNFLLPQKKALRATEDNKALFERRRDDLVAQNTVRRDAAGIVAGKLRGLTVLIIRQAGETAQLYGSVSARDISSAIAAAGYPVNRNQIMLDKPIKTLGLYPVRVALHPELIETITVNVARTEDEGQRQARGETVAAAPTEEAAPELADLVDEVEGADAESPAPVFPVPAEAGAEQEPAPKRKRAKAKKDAE